MTERRVLEKWTRVIMKDVDVKQPNVWIVDEHREKDGSWEYVLFPAGGGFGIRVPENDMFEEWRQVHPSELERVEWERVQFGFGDWVGDSPTPPELYWGWWKGVRWNGWADPWFEDEVLEIISARWNKEADDYLAEHGGDDLMRLYRNKLGNWTFKAADDEEEFELCNDFVFVEGREEAITVFNLGMGLIWDSFTPEELAKMRGDA